uniref:Uncharacterized protein n=1 Tax=Panagrellus redivivus TaxID=6233 RepID=A0A7E4VPC9_PANRE
MTTANVNSFDFSTLGSNLSIASSYTDSGIFSIGQLSHRPSLDSVNTAPVLRRASDPEVVSIGPDVINPMDWLKHRLSLPLDGHAGTTSDTSTQNPVVSDRIASEPVAQTQLTSLLSLLRETVETSNFGGLIYPF